MDFGCVHPDRQQRLADLRERPQYRPSFELNKRSCKRRRHRARVRAVNDQAARGRWEDRVLTTDLESFTLMAGWAASPSGQALRLDPCSPAARGGGPDGLDHRLDRPGRFG